jgi:hypothetical protein
VDGKERLEAELFQVHFLAAARIAKRLGRRDSSSEERKEGKGATASQRKSAIGREGRSKQRTVIAVEIGPSTNAHRSPHKRGGPFGQISWIRPCELSYIDSCRRKCQLVTQSLHFPSLRCSLFAVRCSLFTADTERSQSHNSTAPRYTPICRSNQPPIP